MPRYHGRLAFDPAVIAQVRAILAERWDSDAALVRAAERIESADPWRPRTLDDFALSIRAILGVGAPNDASRRPNDR